eukprot:TRINITY_DN6366_c0_g1_i1.p1 TRINITY_DN6366_c0_g1~~TRINITY_DN6366_c0_g1_i1.p1  ORF type:complete len:379 (+),score=112.82 TRINITY_DN6366_c0_g1_i1:155-1291(+)
MAKDKFSANPMDSLRKKEKSKALKKNKKQRDANLINRDPTKMLEKVERLQHISKTVQEDRTVMHKLTTIQAQYEKLMKLKKQSDEKSGATTTNNTTKTSANQPSTLDVGEESDEYEEEEIDLSIMPPDLPLPPTPFPAPPPTTQPPEFAFPKPAIHQDEGMVDGAQISENGSIADAEKNPALSETLLSPEPNRTNPPLPNIPNLNILPPPPPPPPRMPIPPHLMPPNLNIPPPPPPPILPIGIQQEPVPRNVSISAVPVKNISNTPTNTEKEKDKEKEKEKEKSQESPMFIPHSLRVKRTEPSLPEKSTKPSKIAKPTTTEIPTNIPILTGTVTSLTSMLRLPSVNLAPTVSSVSATDEKMDDALSEFMNEIEDLEGF